MFDQKQEGLINQGTLSDQVFNYLSRAILSGDLQAGDRLVETDLAETLGISRGPVREALVELERQGLAYSEVRRGTFVKPWTKDDLWEVATLRANLEALVAKLAVIYITDADLAFFERVVEDMEHAEQEDDIERLIDLDCAFHSRVIERCQHERLQQVLGNMHLQIRLFRLVTRATDYVSHPEMHRTLIDAFREGNPEHAYQATYAHIMESAEAALACIPDEGPLSISSKGRKNYAQPTEGQPG